MSSWNSRRALAAAVLATTLLAVGGSAVAAGGKGPAKAKLFVRGGSSFKPNAYIQDGVHFVSGTVVVRSGGTVTLTNTTTDPHTLSIVAHSQLPRTIKQVENCAVCGAIEKSHGVNPEGPPPEGPPPITLVNVGASGFNAPGDSIFLGPKGQGGQVTFKVTAHAGTKLNFMCIIHPWMQGRILVR